MKRLKSERVRSPVVTLVRPAVDVAPRTVISGEIRIRPYQGESDRRRWLDLQNEAFSDQRRQRRWDPAEFDRELAGRPWWRPDLLLLAETDRRRVTVGSVAIEPLADTNSAQVHWLAVHPAYRRRGIARRLVEEASCLAGSFGKTELRAETLRTWRTALRFYLSVGFEPVE